MIVAHHADETIQLKTQSQALGPAISAFQRVRGFELRYVMATLRPLMLPTSPRGEILRASQCEERGTYALVRLYGASDLDWVSRYRRALITAGYSEKSPRPDDDEVVLIRWVSGRRALLRENGSSCAPQARERTRRVARRSPSRRDDDDIVFVNGVRWFAPSGTRNYPLSCAQPAFPDRARCLVCEKEPSP